MHATGADDAPVAGADVTIVNDDGARVTATTGDAGDYTRDVPPGTYAVEVRAFGYVTEVIPDVVVDPGETVTVDVALTSTLGTVAGTVTDPAGAPVVDATVDAASGLTPVGATTTDADGAYELELPAGTYDLTAAHPDWRTAVHDGVEVTTGQTSIVDVTLEPRTGTLAGTVVDDTGAVVPGAEVAATDADGETRVATTAADGTYTLELPVGDHDLEVGADGFWPSTLPQTVTTDTTTTLDVTIESLRGSLEGQVLDAHTGGPVDAVDAALADVGVLGVDDAGAFVFDALVYGTYGLEVTAEGHHGEALEVEVERDATTSVLVELFPTTACADRPVPVGGFADVEGVHAASVDCMAWFAVVQGVDADTYAPRRAVTRAQMSSMLARMVEATDTALPDADHGFTDLDGNVHEDRIAQLAEAGIVLGRTDTTFEPDGEVTRAQTVTMLARAWEFVIGEPLPEGPSVFTDVDGNVHRDNIEAAAAAGLVQGVSETEFAPDASTRREQMASLLARTLDRVAGEVRVPGPV